MGVWRRLIGATASAADDAAQARTASWLVRDAPDVAERGVLNAAGLRRWIGFFVLLGLFARIMRYAVRFPLWDDESFLCVNFISRSYTELLRPLHAGEVTMLAITAHSSFRLHSEAGWADTVLAHLSPKLRECASVQLHEVILDRRLGVPYRTRHNGLQESSDHVLYESDMATAVRAVANGANVAFVMGVPNPPLLLDISSRDELLPARSAELGLDLPGLMNHVVG